MKNLKDQDRQKTPQPVHDHLTREEALDKTIADTFPASDPLSTLPNPDEEDEDVAA